MSHLICWSTITVLHCCDRGGRVTHTHNVLKAQVSTDVGNSQSLHTIFPHFPGIWSRIQSRPFGSHP